MSLEEQLAEIPSTARVVIIGGGAVGVSSLYHLAKAGWTDCVLLEKNELTSGSTWHAAGNVPTFSSSWSLMNMQRYSAELYRGLAEEVGYPMNYHVTGSLRLAHTQRAHARVPARQGHGPLSGHGHRRRRPRRDQARAIPFIETHDLKGALYDPNDGDIDPAQLTQALAKGARDMGAKIVRFCPVTGVRRDKRRMGRRRRRKAKSAANMSSTPPATAPREVGKMFGRDVPMMVMSHQYILFEEIPELAAWSKEARPASCRCCATSTPPTICGRKRTA